MVKKYHHGGSHGYTSPIGSYGREEQAFAGESNVQQESYDPGHKSESDKGSSQENKGTGETGSSGHSILDALNKLKAEGKGDTEQAKVYERYLVGVEQKYQSEGTSLYASDPEYQQKQYEMAAGVGEFGGKPLTEWEKIQKLAGMEAADPKYAKSFAGKEFLDQYNLAHGTKLTDKEIMQTDAWTYQFGMPSIVLMPTFPEYGKESQDYWKNLGANIPSDPQFAWGSAGDAWGDPVFGKKDPTKTTLRTDEYGNEIGGKYIYSGLGKTLMDQLEGATSRTLPPGFDYGTAKEAYWDDRAAQESIDQSQRTSWGGYDGGGGGDGGTGYYGDPRTGNPVEQMANFYTPQADLQQAMVNVHSTPTVFAKRGGIVSLLRL